MVEGHGSLNYLQCVTPGQSRIWTEDSLQIDVNLSTFRAAGTLPKCPYCGALARPNVLMFYGGQWVPNRAEEQAVLFHRWLRNISPQELVVVKFGAGRTVPTVRLLSKDLTRVRKGFLIRINPREPEIPVNGVGIRWERKKRFRRFRRFFEKSFSQWPLE
jgi:NAD-dependent SIR2 family protein deacetylase